MAYQLVRLHSTPATGGSSTPATGGEPVVAWPGEIPCADLHSIFDDADKVPNYDNYPYDAVRVRGRVMTRNLKTAVAKVIDEGARNGQEPTEYCVVADLGGSKVNLGWGVSPCLTKSREASLAFWSMQHGRHLTVRELCRLQGIEVLRFYGLSR